MVTLLLAIVGQADPAFDFDVRSGRGLEVRVAGVPVIRGSWFQYYEPDWSRGYYSSSWQGQAVRKVDNDTYEVTFTGADGRAAGKETLHREGNRLKIHYRFEWSGDHPVKIEVTPGMIAAPVFESGTLLAGGSATRTLASAAYPSGADLAARRFAPDSTGYSFQAPLADLDLTSSTPVTLFDGRGYKQDWAEGKGLWWYGALGLEVARDRPAELDIELSVRPHPLADPKADTVSANVAPLAKAVVPDETIAPLIPKPKRVQLDYATPKEITGVFAFPAGQVRYWSAFKAALARRFAVPAPAKGALAVNIDGGVSRLDMKPGGYTISISSKGVSVLGEEDEGLRNGMLRLARLVYTKGGRLWLPTGRIEDEPQTAFRGVHLFAGTEARAFQSRLWERVLLPLGMNSVVIQCERADWKSTPLDSSVHPMSLSELAGLFADYRKMGIEPTPLIQSFGHMEWFFAGKRRLDLALNRDEPYTIDPRKPESKRALTALWNEAAALLKPKAIHFGCDEVDMVGVSPHNPQLTTQLWQLQMPILGEIAKSHGAKMMIWGDKALAPGEAVDAALGDSREEATKRRAAIPVGTTICDWHYKDDPRPESYYPTLQLWKREGFTPIASAWYRPNNVRGFNLAATMERAGTLQTTWAGYESSERAMIDNLAQFTAMVLAADYSWSGRSESVDRLGYDPAAVFREMYFAEPIPVRSRPGFSFAWGVTPPRRTTVGTTAFALNTPLEMRSNLDKATADAPTTLTLTGTAKGSRLTLALDTARALNEGESVADVEVTLGDGHTVTRRLVYGHHLRAASDPGLVPYAERSQGICAVPLSLGPAATIKRIVIRALSQTAGLRLYGATVW